MQANETVMAERKTIERVESAIHLIRGQRVMLDSDLAQIYEVSTKQLNQQLKRNRDRFPEDFAFQLTPQEFTSLRSQVVTSKRTAGKTETRDWFSRARAQGALSD